MKTAGYIYMANKIDPFKEVTIKGPFVVNLRKTLKVAPLWKPYSDATDSKLYE